YVALISLLLRMGKKGEAFEYSEQLREYSFLKIRDRADQDRSSPQVEEAKARVGQLQEMLDQENSKPTSRQRPHAMTSFSDELAKAQNELQELMEHESRGPVPQPLPFVRSDSITRALPPRTAVLEYVVTEDKVVIFVLTVHGLHVVLSPVREP